MTLDGMRGRGGEGGEALDTLRKSSIYSDDQFRLRFWNVIRWKLHIKELCRNTLTRTENGKIERYDRNSWLFFRDTWKWCLTLRKASKSTSHFFLPSEWVPEALRDHLPWMPTSMKFKLRCNIKWILLTGPKLPKRPKKKIWMHVRCLKRGKTRVIRLWLILHLISYKDDVSSLDKSQGIV